MCAGEGITAGAPAEATWLDGATHTEPISHAPELPDVVECLRERFESPEYGNCRSFGYKETTVFYFIARNTESILSPTLHRAFKP